MRASSGATSPRRSGRPSGRLFQGAEHGALRRSPTQQIRFQAEVEQECCRCGEGKDPDDQGRKQPSRLLELRDLLFNLSLQRGATDFLLRQERLRDFTLTGCVRPSSCCSIQGSCILFGSDVNCEPLRRRR